MMTVELDELIKLEGDHGKWQSKEGGGLPCEIYRNKEMGFWLGYVGVPKEHPCYEMEYDDVYEKYHVDVHGGLTYAGFPVSFYSKDNGNEEYWYLGFDCGHAWDLSPFDSSSAESQFVHLTNTLFEDSGSGEEYRTKEYVIEQTNKLAEQLSNIHI